MKAHLYKGDKATRPPRRVLKICQGCTKLFVFPRPNRIVDGAYCELGGGFCQHINLWHQFLIPSNCVRRMEYEILTQKGLT